jgi:hypothetical protein
MLNTKLKKVILLVVLFLNLLCIHSQIKLSDPIKLCSDNRVQSECFGWTCVLNNNYCLIGTPERNTKIKGNYLQEAGIVYVFNRKSPLNWELKQKLNSTNTKAFDFYGGSVSMNDSFIAVGATGIDDSITNNSLVRNGAVFVYKKNKTSWYLHQTIKLSQSNYIDNFGDKVIIYNNRLYINALTRKSKVDGSISTGGIFIYELNNTGLWELKKQILPPEKNLIMFGSIFAIEDNLLLVNCASSKNVFLFQLDKELSLQHKLIYTFNNPQKEAEGFGNELAFSKGQIIIAAYGSFEHHDKLPDDDSLVLKQRQKLLKGAGCIYIYEPNKEKYELKQKLIANDNKADLHFGNCIAIKDSLMLVGAFGDKLDSNCKDNRYAGAAYLFTFKNGQWKQHSKITSPKRATGDKFGFSVSVDSDNLIIGSRFDKEDANELNPIDLAGSAYMYKIIKGSK